MKTGPAGRAAGVFDTGATERYPSRHTDDVAHPNQRDYRRVRTHARDDPRA